MDYILFIYLKKYIYVKEKRFNLETALKILNQACYKN